MKDGKERVWDMRKRSFQYALRAIKLYQALQERKDGTGWILGNQSLPLRCPRSVFTWPLGWAKARRF